MIEICCLLHRTGGGDPGIKTPQEKSEDMKPAAVEGAKSAAMKPSAVEGDLKRRRLSREASYSVRRHIEAWPRKKDLSQYHHSFPQFSVARVSQRRT